VLSLWLIAIDPVLDREAILYSPTADAYLQQVFLAGGSRPGRWPAARTTTRKTLTVKE